MNETSQKRIHGFLTDLETALGSSTAQTRDIVEEVRADLDGHIERFRAEGHAEDEAVARALDQMGNPYELAHGMKREIPPFGGKAVTAIRYVGASVVLIWLLVLMWALRSWSYGLSGVTVLVGVVLFHLPVILLIWPRIVWRKNWLFGLVPAGLAFLVALFMASAGTQSSQQITLPRTGEEAVAMQQAIEEKANHGNDDTLQRARILVFTTATIFTVVLLLAMQRRSQRRIVLLATGIGIALVEGPFQVEEFVFRRDLAEARASIDVEIQRTGSLPTAETCESRVPRIRLLVYDRSKNGGDYSLFWDRPLSPACSIFYTSQDGRIRVQD